MGKEEALCHSHTEKLDMNLATAKELLNNARLVNHSDRLQPHFFKSLNLYSAPVPHRLLS